MPFASWSSCYFVRSYEPSFLSGFSAHYVLPFHSYTVKVRTRLFVVNLIHQILEPSGSWPSRHYMRFLTGLFWTSRLLSLTMLYVCDLHEVIYLVMGQVLLFLQSHAICEVTHKSAPVVVGIFCCLPLSASCFHEVIH